MLLGSSIIDPTTGQRGEVVSFHAGKPIGRAPDGKLFRGGESPRGNKPGSRQKNWQVRVIDDDGTVLTDWLPAVRRMNAFWVQHPVFSGQPLGKADVEVRGA
jgi:hypothetical protein